MKAHGFQEIIERAQNVISELNSSTGSMMSFERYRKS